MQMSNGKIEINGITYGIHTSIDEILGDSRFHSYVNNNGTINIFTLEDANVSGCTFNVKFVFVERQLSKIQLIPVKLEIKDPGYPDETYQKEKKKVSDSFLRSNLGNPSKESEAVLYYDFDWGSVASVAFLSGRNEFTGGFIEISYRK